MADYKHLEKQEKNIEKEYAQLQDEYKHLLREGKLQIIEKKYKDLLERKKSGKLDYSDEILLGIYEDAIKIQKHKK